MFILKAFNISDILGSNWRLFFKIHSVYNIKALFQEDFSLTDE